MAGRVFLHKLFATLDRKTNFAKNFEQHNFISEKNPWYDDTRYKHIRKKCDKYFYKYTTPKNTARHSRTLRANEYRREEEKHGQR